MPIIPSFGSSLQNSDISFLLQDQLNGMGDFLNKTPGSLNWCEAFTYARSLVALKNFVTLLANQLSPNSSSIFLNRWATMYNTLGLSDPDAIQDYIELKQAQFGTPPNLNNLKSYFQSVLGDAFIDIEWAPELQPYATVDPITFPITINNPYSSPLSRVLVYVWQPRDNQDNLLMPNNVFNAIVESYHSIIEAWNPAYTTFQTMNLSNRGFQDGYCAGNNGGVNGWIDGYNVVSVSAGSSIVTGVGTAFQTYPDGSDGDFTISTDGGFFPPIQIVDDNGILQTYYVLSVQSNTQLTLTSNAVNNITSRSYRCLGVILDISGALDSMLLSSGFTD